MRRYLSILLAPLALLADFQTAAEEIVQAGRVLNAAGLCPATAGNFSCKAEEGLIAVTVSGKHKGHLTTDDVILVDLEGVPQKTAKKPSAETLLHTILYQTFPDIGAGLHTHSVNAIVLTRLLEDKASLTTEGYEIHKVFNGIKTHESTLVLPIFENSQDYVALSAEVKTYLQAHPETVAILLRGHGIYTWGKTMQEALIRIEALEHLFECELKLNLLRNS